MRVLYATSEALPFWKTGGLGDVARALPDALTRLGHDVLIVHPFYRFLKDSPFQLEPAGFSRLPWPGGDMTVRYLEDRSAPKSSGLASTLFVDQPYFFDTTDPYGPTRFDRLAAGRRFAIFCRAIVDRAREWGADLIHLNDWPTGLVPIYAELEGLQVPTLFSVHNLGYQGNFPPSILPEIGVPREYYRIDAGLEFYGTASFLKAGLALSDSLSTVSPSYADEIQTPTFGAGLDGLLHSRSADLTGILNGIDFRAWDPETDRALITNYDADSIRLKEENRRALIRETGIDGGGPIVVMVSRLVEQKGVDLLLESLDQMIERGVRLVVLGSGDRAYERELMAAAREFPRRVAVHLGFDDELARRLYAGGDLFLMPSIYEPCGLGQMIAQRYGTPPIVRSTGGLADTVSDGVTGFAFSELKTTGLLDAVERAAWEWRGPNWNSIRRRCMRLDHSWTRSATEYEHLYQETVAARWG